MGRYKYVEDYEDYSEPTPPDGQDSEPCECGGVVDYWDAGDQTFYDQGSYWYKCRECDWTERV